MAAHVEELLRRRRGEGDAEQYCPSSKDLAELTGLELWAEGAEGDFHLEVKSIAAVAACVKINQ